MRTITIPLTRGYVAVISAADADLARFKWCAHVKRGRAYAVRRQGKRLVRMHRIIAERMVGRALSTAELVDHADRNSLNNTRGNLRLATHAQNSVNCQRRRDNKSGLRGVSWHRGRRRWRACCAGKFLGYFDDPYQAHEAYLKAAIARWGEYLYVDAVYEAVEAAV